MVLRLPKRWGWLVLGLGITAVVVWSLLPKPVEVDVVPVSVGPLIETRDAEAYTEYSVRYVVDMPVHGSISAPVVRAGDTVVFGQTVVAYQAPSLDERQRQSLLAQADASDALVRQARQRLRSMEPLLDQAERRAGRMSRLLASGAVAKEDAEIAHDVLAQMKAEVAAAEAQVVTADHQARAARSAASTAPGTRVLVTAPASGIVLRVHEKQARTLAAGSPILEIGDPSRMDVVIDVLSVDAVRIRAGMEVLITGWGGPDTLRAEVRRVEPAARRKVSTLGVEEQRVDIIATIRNPPTHLGDGFKVDAGIVLWRADSALTVPLTALVRYRGQWTVFVVDGSRAERRTIEIGHRSATHAEVRNGLRSDDVVVIHPPEDLQDGGLIEALTEARISRR